jgi:hypothetical protein
VIKGAGIAAVAVCSWVGCAGETGIVVAIGVAAGQPSPAELLVMVAGPTEDPGEIWLDGASDRFALEGRDLAAEPFRYMVRPGEAPGPVRVAVAGLDAAGETLTADYGPLEFHDGVVLEVAIELAAGAARFDECSRCFTLDNAAPLQIVSEFDRDCDGARVGSFPECADIDSLRPVDCDDRDARRSPALLELCDGVDNNCDEQRAEFRVGCFTSPDTCVFGAQSCDDEAAVWGDCAPGVALETPPALCEAWDACAAEVDPVSCLASVLDRREYDCEIEVVTGEDDRACQGGEMHRFPTTCEELYVIEGNAALGLELLGISIEGPQRLGCEVADGPSLSIDAERLPRPERVTVLEVGGEGKPIAHVFLLTPRYAAACGAETAVRCVQR